MKISENLTQAQKDEIKNRAIEMAYEDSQQNSDYLYNIIQRWVNFYDVSGQLGIITSDEDFIREIVTFDPSTGKLWDDD